MTNFTSPGVCENLLRRWALGKATPRGTTVSTSNASLSIGYDGGTYPTVKDAPTPDTGYYVSLDFTIYRAPWSYLTLAMMHRYITHLRPVLDTAQFLGVWAEDLHGIRMVELSATVWLPDSYCLASFARRTTERYAWSIAESNVTSLASLR